MSQAMTPAIGLSANQRQVLQALGVKPLRLRRAFAVSAQGADQATVSGVRLHRAGDAPAANDPLLLAILQYQPADWLQHDGNGVHLLLPDAEALTDNAIDLTARPAAAWKRRLWRLQRACRMQAGA